jgi:ATP-dependent Lon protease
MSPFIIKKAPKNRISKLNKKYKMHSDDPSQYFTPESDNDSDQSSSSSNASAESSPRHSSKRSLYRDSASSSKKPNKGISIFQDEKHQDVKKSKSIAASSSSAKMIASKLASAFASGVISAVIEKHKKDLYAESSRKRRRDEEEEQITEDDEDETVESDEEVDDDDVEDSTSSNSDESGDDEDNSEDNSDDDDEEDDSEYDSEYDDDDEDDSEYDDDEDDDESSEAADERRQKTTKRKQDEINATCAKNRQKLADIKVAIEKMSELSSSDTLGSNKIIKKQINDLKQQQIEIESQLRSDEKKRDRFNVKEFKTLLKKKNSTNDLRYFRRHMTQEEQQKVIRDLKQIHEVSIIQKPYRLTLLETDIPIAFKAIAMRKINSLRTMEPGCGEYYKVKTWVDTFMKIPFNRRKNLPLTIEDGIQKCSEFMESSKATLDQAVYGLNDAKLQIMQMVGQWISNPGAMGTAIAIQGPMGTGKTSLVKEGISKILGRDFAFIALGGATDSSFLEGHSYTYEGSTWGKIVEILIHCGSMNPVIYFDELDKISDTAKGEEIVGILTHLTDTSQNSQFHDRYFSEIDFDLSKCLFIFSYNDESKVNPILLDRMYRINTSGYNKKDKTQIAQKYLIPKICTQVGFREGDIIFTDPVIEHIVENYTDKEEGVRNLKRCLEVVHRKLNLYRLIKPGTPLFENELSLKVEFPLSITNDVIDKLIKQSGEGKRPHLSLYL